MIRVLCSEGVLKYTIDLKPKHDDVFIFTKHVNKFQKFNRYGVPLMSNNKASVLEIFFKNDNV